jgi:hypothetical protein
MRRIIWYLFPALLVASLSLAGSPSRTFSDGLSGAQTTADAVGSALDLEAEIEPSEGLSTIDSSIITADYRTGDPFVHGGKKYIPLVKAEKLAADWDIGWILPDAYIILTGKHPRVAHVPWSDFDPDNPLSLIPGALGTLLAIGPSASLHMAQNVPVGPNRWSVDRIQVLEGSLLFEPHIVSVPIPIFTRVQAFEMAFMVDWEYQRTTYPEFYEQQTTDLVRFNMTSSWTQIGDPAPDFELPTVDGGALRLSDHRGKIIVFNFCSIT